MMKTLAHPILSQPSAKLRQLIAKAEALIEIEQELKNHLDPGLTQHCHVANLRHDCLIIAVDNAMWATRLRFIIPTLLQQLKKQSPLKKLNAIDYFILPNDEIRMEPTKHVTSLSKESAKLIDEIAKTISHDKLRGVLERLAENGELET